MRKNQYDPFDDFNSCITGYDIQGEELPWQEVARRLRKMPHEQKSEMLSHLTDIYRTELKSNGEIKALERFWREVELLLHDQGAYVTKEMFEILQEAKAGNIKAAQVMVRANPVVIHLPFIAQILRYVISQHKYCDAKDGVLEDIKKTNWDGFLPPRIKRITYDKEDLRKLVELVRKQEHKDKQRAVEMVSDVLKISRESILKMLSIKGRKPGHPKEQ